MADEKKKTKKKKNEQEYHKLVETHEMDRKDVLVESDNKQIYDNFSLQEIHHNELNVKSVQVSV